MIDAVVDGDFGFDFSGGSVDEVRLPTPIADGFKGAAVVIFAEALAHSDGGDGSVFADEDVENDGPIEGVVLCLGFGGIDGCLFVSGASGLLSTGEASLAGGERGGDVEGQG